MRKFAIIAAATVGVVLFGALTVWTFAQARTHDYMMLGVVVAEENVALDVSDQPGATDSIVVDEVLAPDDSWLVVHLDEDGMPGMRVGVARVPEGVSRDVVIELDDDAVLTDDVIVALHADRGRRDEFEFSMDAFHRSPDKPYFVEFEEVARRVSVR